MLAEDRLLEILKKFSPPLFRGLELHPQLKPLVQGLTAEADSPWGGLATSDADSYHAALQTCAQRPPEEFNHNLRLAKLAIFSHLAARDLLGLIDLPDLTFALSQLAAASLDAALLGAAQKCRLRYGWTELPFKPVVMGLGKLGGGDLNYSSDIDLVYLYELYDKNLPASAIKFFFQNVSRFLAELTPLGLVFRVDLDLRPGGKESPLAQSVGEALNHILSLGRPWERLAWLRARPVAGDLAVGQNFLADLAPFIFRRHLDYVALEELAAIKNKMKSAYAQYENNIKLGPGGIREVEFLVQTLILTFGGRHLALRQPGFFGGLKALADNNILPVDEAQFLKNAYIFLRKTEHRLQLWALTQTQTLPSNTEEMERLAQSLDFAGHHDFLNELGSVRTEVREKFSQLLAGIDSSSPQKKETAPNKKWVNAVFSAETSQEQKEGFLKEAGFLEHQKALKHIAFLQEANFFPASLSRYQVRLNKLLPQFLLAAAKAPDPDAALLKLTRFFTAIGPRSGYLIMLEENPKLVELLLLALGSSGFLGEIIIRHPSLLDAQVSKRALKFDKSKEEMSKSLKAQLALENDGESKLALIRRYKNEEFLRLGLSDLNGHLDLFSLNRQLSELAECVVEETLLLAVEALYKKEISLEDSPIMVGFMGKLGGGELSYLSDLDLIFFADKDSGPLALKCAQRLYHYLTLEHAEGPGYEVDARLRPSGGSGPLVTSLDSFIVHHENSELWERQALLKFRPGPGPWALQQQITAAVNRTLWHNNYSENIWEELDAMLARLIKERAPNLSAGNLSPKFGPGGQLSIEFFTQYHLLLWGKNQPNLRQTNTLKALAALADFSGRPVFTELAEAYIFLCRLATNLGLAYGRKGDRAFYSPQEFNAIAASPDEGLEKFRQTRQKVLELTAHLGVEKTVL